MNKVRVENITLSDRIVRVVAGLVLVYSILLTDGILGTAALLPIIAIYPLMTGFIGWDPIVKLFTPRKKGSVTPLNGVVTNARSKCFH